MEDSFQLLSTMSPKIKKGRTIARKGPTLLSLKKHFRRSSICDSAKPTIPNESLVIVDKSSTEASDSSSQTSRKKTSDVIEISDSDYSNSTGKGVSPLKDQPKVKIVKNQTSGNLLTKTKQDEINKWIDDIITIEDSQCNSSQLSNLTKFSEVSMIPGDEHFSQKNDMAANSTFELKKNKRFDEFFKSKSSQPVRFNSRKSFIKYTSFDTSVEESFETNDFVNKNELLNESCSNKNAIIEDSFVLSGNNLNSKSNGPLKDDGSDKENFVCNTLEKLCLKDSFDEKCKTVNDSFNDNVLDESGKDREDEESVEECSKVLDDLYGDSWRKNQESVLPKSEPRPKKPSSFSVNPATEWKPKRSLLYKNPYADNEKSKSNKLLQILHTKRMKANMESPWMNSLKNLCDSDTEDEEMPVIHKTKLNFDNDSNSSSSENKKAAKKKSSVKETSSSESSFESDLGLTLEEKIKNKINNIKEPVKNNKKKTSKSSVGKRKEKESSKKDLNSPEEKIKKKICDGKTTGIKKSTVTNTPKKESKLNEIKPKRAVRNKYRETIDSDTEDPDSSSNWTPFKKEKSVEVGKNYVPGKLSDGTYSFLASLSGSVPLSQCDISARIFRSNFKQYRDKLVRKLFDIYNSSVFDNAMPEDFEIQWNDRMRGTAGFCYCKKITRRTGVIERTARIALSTKVLDSADRLRDTLIHEMCHAATWLVNHVSDGHGPFWKSWAEKAMTTFPELPPIKRCHEYTINTKYTYKCTGCGYSIGRHTKSLDIERKRCGYCYGVFEVLINKTTKNGESKSVPATPKRKLAGFALFVKENYATHKTPQLTHADVMKLLGQKFSELNVDKKRNT